jgi:hypothetical protein
MDLGKDLQPLYISTLQAILEEKFSAKFEVRQAKHLDTDKSINDITVHFDLIRPDFQQTIYFFIDRKFNLNLIKTFINEIDSLDLNSDLTARIINEVNHLIMKKKLLNNLIIKKKISDKTENEYSIGHTEILKGFGTPLSEGKVSMSVISINSNKGDLTIGFLTPESMKNIKERGENSQSSKKSYNKVFPGKEKKEDFQGSGIIISTVQLLEIKRVVLTNLNEIKDLKGDAEFLLRKSKAVTELSKLWFEIMKEE